MQGAVGALPTLSAGTLRQAEAVGFGPRWQRPAEEGMSWNCDPSGRQDRGDL